MPHKSALVISLDFELCWGIIANRTIESYKKNIIGARSAIPHILKLFSQYNIHATWAVVGFLFFDNKEDLIKKMPANKPLYSNPKLSSYNEINNLGANETKDPFHYAKSLVGLITSYPNQEIATHTFSHYYCLEAGQNKETFKDDLRSAIEIAEERNLKIESIVFTRNQINKEYLPICQEMGIKAYRGILGRGVSNSFGARIIRLLDSYLNITGHNTYFLDKSNKDFLLNIPASRFLRPCANALLEPFRLYRILSSMTYAAKNNQVYHIWWHPHNFGADIERNILFLEKILKHFSVLQKEYGMQSFNMQDLISKT